MVFRPEELDASILLLDPEPHDLDPLPIARSLPVRESGMQVYVIGHPLGGELSFSLHDNLLLDYQEPP